MEQSKLPKITVIPGFNEEEIDEIKEIFNLLKTDGTGTVNPKEIIAAL
jgi:centrin-1